MAQINDGTYSLADIEVMNQAIEESLGSALEAMERAKAQARKPR